MIAARGSRAMTLLSCHSTLSPCHSDDRLPNVCHSEERKRRGILVFLRAERKPRSLASLGMTLKILLLLATMLALAAPLFAKSWRISNFQDTITVNPDGSALVNETITLKFVGEWHGIHRTIPIEYPGPDGTNYELYVDVTSVTEENGAKLKYDSSSS